MKNIARHLSSFAAPIVMCVVLPYLIIVTEHQSSLVAAVTTSPLGLLSGLAISTLGLSLLLVAIRLFILIGNGTIMPWDPTRKLIVVGLYRHVRNPMILSIIILQVGEAILFTSWGVAILALVNFSVNTVYFIFSEEPGLEQRFGAEYLEYKQNVPRWIPRLKPWRPG